MINQISGARSKYIKTCQRHVRSDGKRKGVWEVVREHVGSPFVGFKRLFSLVFLAASNCMRRLTPHR